MLAAINAVATEFSNAKRRSLCVSLMAIGYPAGAVAGGTVAAQLLQEYDWRSVFYFGAAVTAADPTAMRRFSSEARRRASVRRRPLHNGARDPRL